MALITVIFNGAPLLLQYNLFWGDIYNSLGQRGKTNFYSITYSVDGFCYCCWMLFCLLHLFINCFINIIFDVQFFSFVMFYNILCLCWNGSFWAITFVVFLLVSLSNWLIFHIYWYYYPYQYLMPPHLPVLQLQYQTLHFMGHVDSPLLLCHFVMM